MMIDSRETSRTSYSAVQWLVSSTICFGLRSYHNYHSSGIELLSSARLGASLEPKTRM